jgi:FlaA1/EpsC-like NDP-sugar epimerase
MRAHTMDRVSWLSTRLVSMKWKRKLAIMLATDSIAVPVCFSAALALSLPDMPPVLPIEYGSLFFVTFVTIIALALSGLYRGVIRYIDKQLLVRAGIALGVGVAALFWLFYFLHDSRPHRNALPLYWFLLFSYLLASRLSVRSLLRHYTGIQRKSDSVVGIYGAGDAGVKLAMAMQGSGKYQAACFLDQKRQYVGRTLAGLQVVPAESHAADAMRQLDITMIILAIPSACPQRRRQIMRLVHDTNVEVKTLTRLFELDDAISIRSIRDIRIEDLLGRAQVPPKARLITKCVTGKNVLVTGAGGSIGSELCRQIMALSPDCLHLLDHSEYALYKIQQELASRFPATRFESHLGSVCDAGLVDRIMLDGDIDTLYHAAAYKHVPLVEDNAAEGLRNNVVGARVIAAAAVKWKISTCVLVSTDKAVRPTSIMGASKRIAELIFQAAALQSTHTVYCMVRFGNVLGSSGSVVPLFRKQIECGGPITITHPDVARYFMLIPEAAQLVVQAGAMAKGGEVFVLNMGDPIKIVDLARTMIEMSGLTEQNENNPDGDIPISYVGLRPGEKLNEELLIGRNVLPSEHPRIMRATEYALDRAVLLRKIDELLGACADNNVVRIKALVQSIITEYTPSTVGKERCQDVSAIDAPAPSIARTNRRLALGNPLL